MIIKAMPWFHENFIFRDFSAKIFFLLRFTVEAKKGEKDRENTLIIIVILNLMCDDDPWQSSQLRIFIPQNFPSRKSSSETKANQFQMLGVL